MNRLACSILVLASFSAQLFAQGRAKFGDTPATPHFAFDDDGGRVQIVPPDFATAGEKSFHHGAVMKSVQQVSIFLGSGWGDAKTRSRETGLSDLLNGITLSDLSKHHIRILPAGVALEDFSDLGKLRLNDLNIQRRLADMLQAKVIPGPDTSTVYVVFLAPEVSSSLGGHKPAIDYAAYHNFFHARQGLVRYVVVPFAENAAMQSAAASRALAETALSPQGDGWY